MKDKVRQVGDTVGDKGDRAGNKVGDSGKHSGRQVGRQSGRHTVGDKVSGTLRIHADGGKNGDITPLLLDSRD